MLTRAKVGSEDGLNHENLIPATLTAVLLLVVMAFAVIEFGTQQEPATEIAGALIASTTLAEPLGIDLDEVDEPFSVGADVLVDSGVELADQLQLQINRFDHQQPDRGLVVSGAEVGLYNDRGDLLQTSQTDGQGLYVFSDLDEGSYTVRSVDATEELPELTSSISLLQVREIDVLTNSPTTVEQVSDSIFSTYIVAFEAISVLLLAALIGAIVVARKE